MHEENLQKMNIKNTKSQARKERATHRQTQANMHNIQLLTNTQKTLQYLKNGPIDMNSNRASMQGKYEKRRPIWIKPGSLLHQKNLPVV